MNNPFGNRPNQPSYLSFGNNNNPMELLSKFNQFKKNFQGDPQQAVMNMLSSGQMSQSQFNQLQEMAKQFMNSFKG